MVCEGERTALSHQLTPQNLYPTQRQAISHLLYHKQAMLWNRMGKGKTVAALTAINERMMKMQIFSTLVVAPLRVCQTVWAKEARKWSHTKHLTFSLVWSKSKRHRERAMRVSANIYLINYDSLRWYCDAIEHTYLNNGLYPPFNAIVFDEITMVKTIDRMSFYRNSGVAAEEISNYPDKELVRINYIPTEKFTHIKFLYGEIDVFTVCRS